MKFTHSFYTFTNFTKGKRMKIIKIAIVSLLLSTTAFAFEPAQLSLDSVSNFEKGDSAMAIRHRFFGKANDINDFFGIDSGANTLLGLRYAPIKNIIIEVHHTREKKEYNGRLGFAYKLKYIHTQLNINAFTFKESGIQEKRSNAFGNLVLQTPLLFEHLTLTYNLGYDNYYKRSGSGFGAELSTNNFMSETFPMSESFSLLGEYYTKHNGLLAKTKKFNSFAFGMKIRTYKHHFEILLTNSTAMDPRTMMQGTDSNNLHFAFNINRKF